MASCSNEVSKDTFIRGRDVFERMNYLYQLSHFWSNSNPDLSAYYAKLMVSISKKAVLRLDSSIKRNICKACSVYFVEGKTVRTRYTSDHGGQIVKVCKRCKTEKRFPASKTKK